MFEHYWEIYHKLGWTITPPLIVQPGRIFLFGNRKYKNISMTMVYIDGIESLNRWFVKGIIRAE